MILALFHFEISLILEIQWLNENVDYIKQNIGRTIPVTSLLLLLFISSIDGKI
jgi:hypothetical protein